jgi:hypothetical protein
VERLERFGQGMAGHFSVPADSNGMLQLDAFREPLLNWPITALFSPQRGAPCKTADSPLGDKKKSFPAPLSSKISSSSSSPPQTLALPAFSSPATLVEADDCEVASDLTRVALKTS